MTISSYKDLIVWQKSFALSKDVYKVTKILPKDEQFGLSSQMRRCAVSIPSNIAEGQQRTSAKEYRQFLSVARGSAGELETQLMLAKEIYGLEVNSILDDLNQVQKMLFTIIKKLGTINSNLEPAFEGVKSR